MGRLWLPVSEALDWLGDHPDLANMAQWKKEQLFALATFYYSTRGDYWVENQGWLDWDTNECDWEQLATYEDATTGLNCNDGGEIRVLKFQKTNNLDGRIPPEISFSCSLP